MTSKEFFYSKDTSLEGILKSFYNSNSLWDIIDIHASSIHSSHPSGPSAAFDFDDNSYWIGNHQEENPTLTFCFTNYFVLSFGFEMKTSTSGETRPKKFQFSSSLDNITYTNPKEYEQTYPH